MTNLEIAGISLATLTIGVCYLIAVFARGPLNLQIIPAPSVWKANPLVITRGPFGRASLSNLQLLFYSLIVLWLLVYALVTTGKLMTMSEAVLVLLGISAAGATAGQATESARHRLSAENWSWLVNKGWIKSTLDKPTAPPSISDLVQRDGRLDVTRLQALGFSLVVGLALAIIGYREGLGDLEIDNTLLSLIGLSQVLYVGGKVVGASPIAEIDAQITGLRDLERQFQSKAAVSPRAATLADAKTKAPDEYSAYQNAARITARLVTDRVQNDNPRSLEPEFP